MQKDLHYDRISYLEADENYTVIHYKDGTRNMHGYNLKVFEDKLSTANFRRIHRKYLVNNEYVKYNFNTSVLLTCGVMLPVSRRRR